MNQSEIKIGRIWILNGKTYELQKTFLRHRGPVYMAKQVGNLIWTISEDSQIFAWNDVSFLSSFLTFIFIIYANRN